MPYHRGPRRQDAPEVLGGAGMTLLEPPRSYMLAH
jgi:hypothetical protein